MANGIFDLHFNAVSVPRAERIAQAFARLGKSSLAAARAAENARVAKASEEAQRMAEAAALAAEAAAATAAKEAAKAAAAAKIGARGQSKSKGEKLKGQARSMVANVRRSLAPTRTRSGGGRTPGSGTTEPLMPTPPRMLDVGCGDGLLAMRTGELLGLTQIQGVDIKAQRDCRIPAKLYDGLVLPFESHSFDIVTVSDVLHHSAKPHALLNELFRVTKPAGAVLVKDHFRFGPVSNAILLAMDILGNYAQGILVRGTYFSPAEWVEMVTSTGGAVDELLWPFKVHDFPWRVVTRSELQFVAKLSPR